MAATQAQEFQSAHGEDVSIVLTGSDNTNPTAFTLQCTYCATPGGTPVLTITNGFTIGGSGPYTIAIPLTRAQTGTTLVDGEYFGDLWRKDSGSAKRLAGWKHVFITPEYPVS